MCARESFSDIFLSCTPAIPSPSPTSPCIVIFNISLSSLSEISGAKKYLFYLVAARFGLIYTDDTFPIHIRNIHVYMYSSCKHEEIDREREKRKKKWKTEAYKYNIYTPCIRDM